MINLGDNNIELMLGNAEVSKAYLGTEQVYPNKIFASLTYQNGDVYTIVGSGYLSKDMVQRGITDSSSPYYYTKITSAKIGELCTYIGNNAFQRCSSLTSVEIPDSVVNIRYSAFQGCSSLTSVTIGNGIRSIDYYAFQGCSSLTSFVCRSTNPPSVSGDTTFMGDSNLVIYVPAESVDAYKAASGWSQYASRIYPIP